MKKFYLVSLFIITHYLVFAQGIVTSGLNLHLDASVGFNDNGVSVATWNDQSGASNHVAAASAITEPVWVSNASNTGFPGVYFDGIDDYMYRSLGNYFDSTSATLFVVRIGNTLLNTTDSSSFTTAATTLSIAEQGSFNHEFALLGDWAIHTTSSGNWLRKTHQCYYSLPDSLPVVTSCILNTGTSSSDISYYVNNILSTNPLSITNNPVNYSSVSRSIIVGARYSSFYTVQSNTKFQGYILEVLAYNRVLNNIEVDSVNEYLRCKYAINYTACNSTVACSVLPLKLLSFAGAANMHDALLHWQIAPTNEVVKFTLQRSTDAKIFQNVYEVTNANEFNSYSDKEVGTHNSKVYYRLMSEENNTITYSKTIPVSFTDFSEIDVFPNPVYYSGSVKIYAASKSDMKVQLLDMAGRIVKAADFSSGMEYHSFDMKNVSSGMYVLKIITGENPTYKKIEIQ